MPRLGQPGRQGTPPPQGLSLPRPWPWSSEPTDRLGCSEGKREGPSSPTDTEVQRPWAWLGLGPPMRFATASASSRSKALRFAGFPARRLPALLLSLTCDCLCLAGSFLIRTCLGIIRALGFISAPAPPPAYGPGTGLARGPLLCQLTSPSCAPSPSSVCLLRVLGFLGFLYCRPPSWLGPPASAPDLGCSGSPCPSADTGWPPSPPALLPVLTPPPPGRSRCPACSSPAAFTTPAPLPCW